ncbi:acid protease [Byssothecium circinans]|uniref:Acid protease n=1 Tax=Byssothecium circinans TaxID=147558 RepID=A0A6A5TN08_9PLEO|nr:acid protease [Byssothecium circinans]
MFVFSYLAFLIPLATCVETSPQERRAPSRIAVTKNVLPLVAASRPYPVIPSSKHLHKRRPFKTAILPLNTSSTASDDDTISKIQQDVLTLGGRVYMINVTLAGKPYTLVIDTGSSDTWIASSTFQCLSKLSRAPLPQEACGFGKLYDKEDSSTFASIPTHTFGVRYTDGEFLLGELGKEVLGVGDKGEELKIEQTIGVVERGWWSGDEISSGLMGLAYSALASNARELNYTSVVFSLFKDRTVPPIFSLALSRPTIQNPVAGGLLAIGGIPDVQHDGEFVSTPIKPVEQDTYAFYSIEVEGFDIAPPADPSSSPGASSWEPNASSDAPLLALGVEDSIPIHMPTSSTSVKSVSTSTSTSTSTPRKKPTKKPTKKPKHPSHTPSPSSHSHAQPRPRQATRPSNSDPNSTIIFVPNLTMVIDSGCTLLYFPDDIADRIASLFVPKAVFAENSNTYLVPCSAAPPRVGVVVAGRSFYVHPDDLMNKAPGAVGGGGVVGGSDGGGVRFGEGRMCTLAVQRRGGGDAVLGDSWLKNVLAVFDLGANEMRFSGREEY